MANRKRYTLKHISRFIFPVFLLLYLQGCINLKIELPDDPGWGIAYFIISDSPGKIEEYKENVKSKIIRDTDENIYAIIKICNIEKKVSVSWVWYGPDKKIVKRSAVTEVNTGEKFLEYFVIWDSLDRTFYNRKKGKWSVALMVDENFLASKSFTVN